MKPKRPATQAAIRLRRALQELAARGINGEQANAKEKVAQLEQRYDFSQQPLNMLDLFKGVFKRAPGHTVPIGTVAELDIASAVKWAIEARTGIPCRFQGATLLAEATASTAKTLQGIVSTLALAFLRLWQTYEAAGGLPADRNCFMLGLFEGCMNEERPPGQPLPARGMAPKTRRRGKATPAAPGLAVHPYSLALRHGRQIRFSVPVAEVENELKDRLTRHIEKV